MAGIIRETKTTAFIERRHICKEILDEFGAENSETEFYKIVMAKYEEACRETRLQNEFKK